MYKEVEKMLTVDEVAEILRVSIGTIYRWASDGRLPHIHLGRLLRFREDEVDNFHWQSVGEV